MTAALPGSETSGVIRRARHSKATPLQLLPREREEARGGASAAEGGGSELASLSSSQLLLLTQTTPSPPHTHAPLNRPTAGARREPRLHRLGRRRAGRLRGRRRRRPPAVSLARGRRRRVPPRLCRDRPRLPRRAPGGSRPSHYCGAVPGGLVRLGPLGMGRGLWQGGAARLARRGRSDGPARVAALCADLAAPAGGLGRARRRRCVLGHFGGRDARFLGGLEERAERGRSGARGGEEGGQEGERLGVSEFDQGVDDEVVGPRLLLFWFIFLSRFFRVKEIW